MGSTPLTGAKLEAKLLELKKAGVTDNQDILKATGYWDGESETYSQANIDFFSAKVKIGETPSLGVMPEPAQLLALVDERHGINAAGLDDTLADILNELDLDIEPFVLAWGKAKYGQEREVEVLIEELNAWFEAPGIYLTGQFRKKLLEHIKGCCEVNSSWYESHAIGGYAYTLLGGWIDPIREILVEFHDYILKEDVGAHITQEQYLEVALTFCETFNPPEEGKMKEYLSGAMYLLNQVSGFNFADNALQFIKRNPQHREALFNSLFEDDTITGESGGEDGRWETALLAEPFFSAFKDLIASKCVEINDYWSKYEDSGVMDYSIFGQEVEDLFTAAGINTSSEAQAEIEKQKAHREMIEAEVAKRKAEAIEFEKTAPEREAAFAAWKAKEAAERAARSTEDIFWDAVNDMEFETIFSEPDKFKELIKENISDIAETFTEENAYSTTGDEPEWLLRSLREAGAELSPSTEPVKAEPQTGAELLASIAAMEEEGLTTQDILIRTGYYTEGGDYGKANIDFMSAKVAAAKADGSWEKTQQESRAKAEALEAKYEADCELLQGKRVCITGKLTATRNEIEGWLTVAGATVVSGVSKTTDVLIVGEKAGSKQDKAKELGIRILSEAEALAVLEEVAGEITDEGSERIINKMINSVPDSTEAGYFKFTDKEETRIPEAQTKEEVRAWLEERVDQYGDFSEAMALKLVWVELSPKNKVTVWYYDEEFSDTYVSDICVRSFNNNSDARAFIEEMNSNWGGHLSTIKVIHKTGDKIKVVVGSELDRAGFNHWDYDYQRIFHNLELYPELKELLSSNIENVFEDEPEDAKAELDEIVRKGSWPKLPEN